MDLLYENPIGVGIVGLVLSAVVAYAGLHLGETKPLVAAIGLLVVTGLLVGLAAWVETDKEQIERTTYEIAAAIRENDYPLVYSYIHPNSTAGLQQARNELPQYTFHDARVTSLREIAINHSTQPPTATSEMLVAIELSSDRPEMYGGQFDLRRLVKIYWMKKNQRWLVRDYQHSDIMDAFTNRGQSQTSGF